MKKILTLLMFAASLVTAGGVAAQVTINTCPPGSTRFNGGPPVNSNSLQTFLTGKTVCARRAPDQWQEYHAPNLDLVDFHSGLNTGPDPIGKEGVWSTAKVGGGNTAQYVIHDYGAGGTYTWFFCAVTAQAGTYIMRSDTAGDVTAVTIPSGQVGCP